MVTKIDEFIRSRIRNGDILKYYARFASKIKHFTGAK